MSQSSLAREHESKGGLPWRLAGLVVFLCGAAMRWRGLARFPFEQDELYTLRESQELFNTSLRPGIDARPLYYLLHHALTPVLPSGELGARLPAFFFGLLGLYVTWRLGRYLAGEAGGFVALTAAVFSPWHVFVSGEARYWSTIYLLAVSALYMLLLGRETDRWRQHLAAGVLLILGALTHPTFIFPFVGIAVALHLEPTDSGLSWRWPSRRAILGTWLPTALIVGTYLVSLKLSGRGQALSNWSGRGWMATVRLAPAIGQLVTPALFAAGTAGVVAALASGSIRAKRFSLVAMAGALSGTSLLLLASTRTDVYADYGVSMLPLAVLGATGLLGLARPERIRAYSICLLGILVMSMIPETVSQLSDGMRFDYRPAFARIAATDSSRPALVWPLILQRYYAPNIRATEFGRNVAQLDSVAGMESEFWVVASENRTGLVGDSAGTTAKWLDNNCRAVLKHDGARIDYREYRVVLFSCGRPVVP